jgi:predicted transcriptional regulator
LQSSNTQLSHLQVLIGILDVCREPQSKVQILEETGVSMRHLGFCLKYLLKQDLVKLHHIKKTYVTTEKGLRIRQQLPQD